MVKFLESRHESASGVHSMRSWDQIVDSGKIADVLERLRGMVRHNVYSCPEEYDLVYPGYAGDLQYYMDRTRRGATLCLGIGTGRDFSNIAEANPDAVGIDCSPQMIELLRRKHPHIGDEQIKLADAADERSFDTEQFDTIIGPYSFLQVVGRERMQQVLNNVHRWLKPGGMLYTDTFNPYLIPFHKPGLETSIREIGTETRIAIYVIYDHLKQHMQELAVVSRNGDEKLISMDLSYYLPPEIVSAIKRAGFASVEVHGGYQHEPFDTVQNEVLVYEARKQPDPSGNGNGRSPQYP